MRGHDARHPRLALERRADDVEQFRHCHALENVTLGACGQDALNLDVAEFGGQRDDPRVGKFGPDCDDGVDPGNSRQPQVHQRDIRPVQAVLEDGLFAGGGLGDKFQAGFITEHRGERLPEDPVIVHAHHADSWKSVIHSGSSGVGVEFST